MRYTQDARICTVVSPLGKDALILHRMSGFEEVSALFRFQLDLVSPDGELPFEGIIGQGLTVNMLLPSGATRHFQGVVSRFSQGGTHVTGEGSDRALVHYEVELVPWLWMLTRVSNSRVFENKSVPDILKEVFDGHGLLDYEFASLANVYPPLEYCVQYQETDFHFVSRLMEEWGLAYSFRHEKAKHTLVMFDSSPSCPDCPDGTDIVFAEATTEARKGNEVGGWLVEQELPPGKLALKDYNFESPSNELLCPADTKLSMGPNPKLELFEYPGCYGVEPDGKQFVKLRMEAQEAGSHWISGSSGSGAFTAGTHVKLHGHYRESYNDKRYLLTRVDHSFTQGVGSESYPSVYENRFFCLPEQIPYRPVRRTPKPLIHGIQTAVVVGPAGEEIHVDKYGRIRIQFHWDRYGKRDGKNVCWARVMQGSAGKRWGAVFTPRIGQEVVVSFLEGDPDRPIVTGQVYNAEQMPPYDLDANKTQSGIKTRSSKGGAPSNFNEMRMEDKKGQEHFYLQAEKDMQVLVKNDRSKSIGHDQSESVGNDESVSIGHDQTTQIGNDETLSVGSNRTRTVGKNEVVTVTLTRTHSVGVNEMINVGAAQEVTVGGLRALTVGLNQTTNVGKDFDTSVGSNLSEQVAKNRTEQVGDSYSLKVGKKIVVDAGDEITIKTGSAKIVMKKNGDITIEGKNINVKGSGDIVMKAKKILQN